MGLWKSHLGEIPWEITNYRHPLTWIPCGQMLIHQLAVRGPVNFFNQWCLCLSLKKLNQMSAPHQNEANPSLISMKFLKNGQNICFFLGVLDVLHGVYFGVVGMKSGKLVLQDLPEKKHLTLLRAGFDILYSYIYIEREREAERGWVDFFVTPHATWKSSARFVD